MLYSLLIGYLYMVLFLSELEYMARGPRNEAGVAVLTIPPNGLPPKLGV